MLQAPDGGRRREHIGCSRNGDGHIICFMVFLFYGDVPRHEKFRPHGIRRLLDGLERRWGQDSDQLTRMFPLIGIREGFRKDISTLAFGRLIREDNIIPPEHFMKPIDGHTVRAM